MTAAELDRVHPLPDGLVWRQADSGRWYVLALRDGPGWEAGDVVEVLDGQVHRVDANDDVWPADVDVALAVILVSKGHDPTVGRAACYATLEQPTPDFERWTRDHQSCLLYLETRIVEHKGVGIRSDPHMNSDDWDAVDDFVAGGLLVWGGTGFHPVFSFTEAGWGVAHALRRLRAEGVPHDSSLPKILAAAFVRARGVELLREQVAFYKGGAEAAAELEPEQ